MALLKQGRNIFIALTVALILTVSMAFGTPSRQITAAAASLRVAPIAPMTVLAETSIERRLNSTTDEVKGQIREKYADVVDDPSEQVKGRTEQLSGKARNRAEDVRDKVRDASESAKEQGEGLVDRVKDFFDADNADTGIDTNGNVTGTQRTGSY